MKSVLIVGAGLAGLTAGFRLKQAGWQVLVLEASREAGGRAASVRKQGYVFDSGAVGLGTVYKDFMSLAEELGLGDRIVRSSSIAATARGGRLYEIDSARPLTALTSKLLSFGSKLKLINLLRDLRRIKPHLDIRDVAAAAQFDDESIASYARRRLNPELLEFFIEPLARTVNLSRASEVSKLEVMNSLAGLFSTTLVHLRGGIAVFTEALAQHQEVRLDTPVLTVAEFADHVEVTCRDPGGGTRTHSAAACVLATPLPRAIELFPDARRRLAPLSDTLQYNRGLAVHLGYRAATRTRALMAMMPPSEQPEIALLFLEHNKAPDRAPPGHSMITVFYDHTAADRPWALDDAVLVGEAAAVTEKYLPELGGRLEMSHVTRWPLGLSHPAPGIYRAMREVNRRLEPGDRIQFAGDYRSTAGQNSAVAWGNNVARNLIEHLPG